jgi:hypothetical protein
MIQFSKEVYSPKHLVSLLNESSKVADWRTNSHVMFVALETSVLPKALYVTSIPLAFNFIPIEEDFDYAVEAGLNNGADKFVVIRGSDVFIDNTYKNYLISHSMFLDALHVDWDKSVWRSDMCDDEMCCPRDGHKID